MGSQEDNLWTIFWIPWYSRQFWVRLCLHGVSIRVYWKQRGACSLRVKSSICTEKVSSSLTCWTQIALNSTRFVSIRKVWCSSRPTFSKFWQLVREKSNNAPESRPGKKLFAWFSMNRKFFGNEVFAPLITHLEHNWLYLAQTHISLLFRGMFKS